MLLPTLSALFDFLSLAVVGGVGVLAYLAAASFAVKESMTSAASADVVPIEISSPAAEALPGAEQRQVDSSDVDKFVINA